MNATMELRKFVAPEIITGQDARLMIGRYLHHFAARKPMIVTDEHLRGMNWFQDIMEVIKEVTSDYVIYDGVTTNPKDYEVMQGADVFLREKCDLIVAIGGGSPIDCAKGISIVSTNGGHILEYEGVDEINLPGPPLICIPTTAGASADVSQFAIICDTKSRIKKAIISKKVVPDLALIDPKPLMTMDSYLTACTGMDALTHAIEAYVSNANSPLSNVHALEAISLIARHIQDAIEEHRDLETMFCMMLGSLHAGLAFSNASLGLVHVMAHSMGGLLDLPHGECNSILLEHVIDLNYDAAEPRYQEIARRMGIHTEGREPEEIRCKLTEKIRNLRRALGIPDVEHISKAPKDLYERLAQEAYADPCMVTNPREVSVEEIMAIFHKVIVSQ